MFVTFSLTSVNLSGKEEMDTDDDIDLTILNDESKEEKEEDFEEYTKENNSNNNHNNNNNNNNNDCESYIPLANPRRRKYCFLFCLYSLLYLY